MSLLKTKIFKVALGLFSFVLAAESRSDIYLTYDSASALQKQFADDVEIKSSIEKLSAKCNTQGNLVIALGESSSLSSYDKCPEASHLATFLAKESYQSLKSRQSQLEQGSGAFGAVVIDQPLDIATEKSLALVGDGARGKLLVLVSRNRKQQVLNEISETYHSKLKIVEIREGQDIRRVAKHHLKKASGILAYPDRKVWGPVNARLLLYLAYENQIPVVGYSSGFTRAGSVLSVYSEQEHIVETTVDSVVNWVEGESQWQDMRHPKEYTVDVNESVFRALGMPASVLPKINGGSR